MARSQGKGIVESSRVFGLKRWNAQSRVTTDWLSLHNDPELSFPDGDCLVYLHEPTQPGRGPSYQVHTSQLSSKGFQCLVDRCIAVPSSPSCAMSSCTGCENSPGFQELYLPAPMGASRDMIFDYHITTRNFFAWLYDLPLVGRTLGKSLVNVLSRLNIYRPKNEEINTNDFLKYLEEQGYSDFRECVDHALGALQLAEKFQLEQLWIDAYSHCIGLYHGLHASMEYEAMSGTVKALIHRGRLEMDIRLDRMNKSLTEFFENEFCGADFGLSQAAQAHFDSFRSCLHGHYIERFGFWPPAGFHESFTIQKSTITLLYADFRNLYQYLVDSKSSASIQDNRLASGGVCILQNINAFDKRFRYESLPHPAPLVPTIQPYSPSLIQQARIPIWGRNSEPERSAAIREALIACTNRDWDIPKGGIVGRYETFEMESVLKGDKNVSIADGRKVRWILIYAILQFLVSVIRAPKEVRDTNGVTYPLCCQVPKWMPWQVDGLQMTKTKPGDSKEAKIELEPDVDYLHTSRSSSSLSSAASKPGRRSSVLGPLTLVGTKSLSQASPLRRLISRRNTDTKIMSMKQPALRDNFVPSYGNGMNETKADNGSIGSAPPSPTSSPPSPVTSIARVSRESSNASGHSRSTDHGSDGQPDMDHHSVDGGETRSVIEGELRVLDEKNKVQDLHCDTAHWDALLAS